MARGLRRIMNLKKIIMLGGVGLASAAAGVAIPQMMKGQSHDGTEVAKADPAAAGHDAGHDKKEKEKKKEKPKDDHGGHGAAGHGGDSHGAAGGEKKAVAGP